MNSKTQGLFGAYSVVTTRATGRIRLQLGHTMEFPVDRVEMSAQQARDVAKALIQAAVLLELNAGAGDRGTVSPQREYKCVNDGKNAALGRVNWELLLLLSATVAGWASIIQVGGHRLGWW